jgi:hypothetical protein
MAIENLTANTTCYSNQSKNQKQYFNY